MSKASRLGDDLYSGARSLRVVQRRKTFYVIAGAVVLLSVLALVVRGLNPGIEFRGGSEFRVSGVGDASSLVGQEAVESVVPDAQARVSEVGSGSVRVQTEELDADETEQVAQALADAYEVEPGDITSSFVGPSWGQDVTRQAVLGLLAFLVLVSVALALYFRTWTMAVAALVALLHDLVVTAGLYALVGFEVTPATVIGFLTIFGFSLYDTVVVFDKVRENTEHVFESTRRTYAEHAELAVNQTVVRSINTTVVAVLPVGSILFVGAFLLGAGTLKDLALALMVGIVAGTYSSIFLAVPLLVDLRSRDPRIQQQAERVEAKRGADARAASSVPAASGAVQPAGGATAVADRPAGQRQQPRRLPRGRR